MAKRQASGRSRAVIFLVVSLFAGVVASAVVWNLIRGFEEELDRLSVKPVMVTVVAANIDLHQGDTIKAEDLKLIELPPDFVPDGVFTKIEELKGRVPRERILAHDLVRAERLAEANAGVGLNAIIPRGMRAVSINVTDASSVSGFLVPGNYVDVLVAIRTSDNTTNTVTLLQAVKVLAVDTNLGGSAGRVDTKTRPSVTLAVPPEDAEKLAHAKAEGDLVLTLRNDVDVEVEEMERLTTSKIIGRNVTKVEEVPPSEVAQRKAMPVIREARQENTEDVLTIMRGGKASSLKVRDDGTLAPSGSRTPRR